MTVTFDMKFSEHLPPDKVANLVGILGAHGVIRGQSASGAVLGVARSARVSRVKGTLRHWERIGWLTWTAEDSDPQETED